MSAALDEKTLEDVARCGEMDYDKWPSMIEPLLQRLNQIVYTAFPMPRPYPNINRPPPSSSPTQPRDSNDATAQTPSTPVRNLPPVPPFPDSSASRVPDSLPPSQDPTTAASSSSSEELPALLLQLFNSVTHTLRTSFSEKSPHTIQRLAELVLYPTKHYKTLPAWLRAVDRVVSVSSTADIFPLSDTPALVNGVNGDGGGGILWNNSDGQNGTGYDNNSLGSDESLGGALLTPIPWLRNGIGGADAGEDSSMHLEGDNDDSSEMVSSGSGSGSNSLSSSVEQDPLVPERADGAVTQGELMRMEQEAGVVPVSARNAQHTNAGSRTLAGAEDSVYMDGGDEEDDVPHARGPDVVGAVDVGRVDGHDVRIRIGSPPRGDADAERSDRGNTAAARHGTDPNDAQTVLPGPQDTLPGSGSGVRDAAVDPDDDFEIVLKDSTDSVTGAGDDDAEAEVDQMQVDETEQSASATTTTTTSSAIDGAEKQQDQKQGQEHGAGSSAEEQDGDIVIVDADGKADDEPTSKADLSGENIGPDAVDTSTVT
ncbi:hypothetical protein ABEF95_015118 [Exophiala dermatitidis]